MSERSSSQKVSSKETRQESAIPVSADRLDEALRDLEARFLLFRGGDVLLEREPPIQPVVVTLREITMLTIDLRSAVLLETGATALRLALDLQDVGDEEIEHVASLGEFRGLHGIQEPIDPQTWELLSRARALLAWNRRCAICPTCGAPTEPQEGGTFRVCTGVTCGRILFPRTDPSVIVRVLSGEKCLLARKPGFAPGVRSVLAGFVEPGESLEGAVRREVAEEVGIAVERIVYLGSQPWPFPMSLMVAFEARACEERIRLDEEELEAADWYTCERVQKELVEGTLVLPSRKSIARRMIEAWLEGRDGSLAPTRDSSGT